MRILYAYLLVSVSNSSCLLIFLHSFSEQYLIALLQIRVV